MHSLLWVTDLAYEAVDRRYGDEDVWFTTQLRRAFTLALCHPLDVVSLMDRFDAVVVRNSGPVIQYREVWDAFRVAARARGTRVFNPLDGKGDMTGKRYLVELSAAGFPVIPTVDRRDRLGHLPDAERYVVKPVFGADSLGVTLVPPERLAEMALDDRLVQPWIDFAYEVSFYFVGRTFHYAMVAPDRARRWLVEPYRPSPADLAFAQRFVEWNALALGIQRVDACRTRDGELLLVELEDLNPYLSLDRLDPATRTAFVDHVERSLRALLAA